MDQTTTGTGDATVGSAVPGLATALGPVGGIAIAVAPEIGRWLFGPDAAMVTVAVQQAAHRVTGAVTPDAQAAALADPDMGLSSGLNSPASLRLGRRRMPRPRPGGRRNWPTWRTHAAQRSNWRKREASWRGARPS